MKEQGGSISVMVIREIVENFIHAHFMEPIISILDGGNTIRFADQGPGIEDKELAFEFGIPFILAAFPDHYPPYEVTYYSWGI